MTKPIKLPPPHGYIYVWDGPYGTHRLVAGQYNGRQCDRTVAYYTEAQVRKTIEADRQARGEPVAEARNAALEEAASLLEDRADVYAYSDGPARYGRNWAEAIRALKSASTAPQPQQIPEGYKLALGVDSIIKKIDALLAIFPHALDNHKFSVSGHGFLKTDSGETKFYEKWAADNLFTELRDGIREVRAMLAAAPEQKRQ